MTERPLPRERLPSGVEARAAAPLLEAAGDQDRARAVWAFAHGMVILELNGRFPADADLDAAWQAGITALQARDVASRCEDRGRVEEVSAIDGRPREVQDWLRQWSPDQQEQVEWLASRVHAAGDGVAEAIKWRRLTFTVDGNWHHWLCAIAVRRQGVRLVFHKGSLLDDPAGLLQGEDRYVRQIPHDRAAADPEAVTALVRQANLHQTDMDDRA
jgi:hypothetical protein